MHNAILSEPRTAHTNDYGLMVGALTILSFSPIVVRLAQGEGIPTPLIAGGRMLLAAMIVTPLIMLRYQAQLQRLTRSDIGMVILTGIWMSLNGLLVILSLERTSVFTNQVFASTAPVWVAIFEVMILKARLTTSIWIGLLLVLLGGGLVALSGLGGATSSTRSVEGDALALVSALCGAVYLTLGRRVRRKVSILPYIWIVYGSGGLFCNGDCVAIGHSFVWLFIFRVWLGSSAGSGDAANWILRAWVTCWGTCLATVISISGRTVVVWRRTDRVHSVSRGSAALATYRQHHRCWGRHYRCAGSFQIESQRSCLMKSSKSRSRRQC